MFIENRFDAICTKICADMRQEKRPSGPFVVNNPFCRNNNNGKAPICYDGAEISHYLCNRKQNNKQLKNKRL